MASCKSSAKKCCCMFSWSNRVWQYIYTYNFLKKRVVFCMQTFQLIFSDMSLVINKACMFYFSFLSSLSPCVILICRTKRNYIDFDAKLKLNIYKPGVHCTNIVNVKDNKRKRYWYCKYFLTWWEMLVLSKRALLYGDFSRFLRTLKENNFVSVDFLRPKFLTDS